MSGNDDSYVGGEGWVIPVKNDSFYRRTTIWADQCSRATWHSTGI